MIWQVLTGQRATLGPNGEGSLFNEAAAIHLDILQRGGLSEDAVRVLSNGAIALPVLLKEMEAPREARVLTFDRSLGMLAGSHSRNRVSSEAPCRIHRQFAQSGNI